MSINKQQIIHIVSELVIITGISIYFNSKVKKLANHIETLENKIIQQEQVIQNHEQLLLRLMNNFEIMNVNVTNIQKSFQQNNNNEENIKTKTKLKNNKKNKSSYSDDKKEEELLKNTTPSLQTIFSHNIPNEQIFIMEMPINPINMMNMNKEQIIQSDKVEEVIDDDEFLDKEIENELKELDDLGEDNNDKNDEDVVDDDDVEENVGDDDDNE